jgi:hypothetical protein
VLVPLLPDLLGLTRAGGLEVELSRDTSTSALAKNEENVAGLPRVVAPGLVGVGEPSISGLCV